MIRLGRTAWNNVIIFAMLIMIFLFNGLHHKILSVSDDSVQSVLPANSAVLTLTFPNLKIERIGTGWRANKDVAFDLSLLELNWRQANGELVERELTESQAITQAELVVAGYEQSIVYTLYRDADGFLLKDNQQRILAIENQTQLQLFPFLNEKN